jgi:hypothetical protein
MARRRQKGKGTKRPKSWHRGRPEARRWTHTQLPALDTGADPTTGGPTPLHHQRGPGKGYRGDAA